MKKNEIRSMIRRRIILILLLILQIALFGALIIAGGQTWRFVSVALQIFSIIAALLVITRPDNSPFKLMWVIIALVFPLFGGVFYIWSRVSTRRLANRLQIIGENARSLFPTSENALPKLPGDASAAHYLQEHEGFPVYTGTDTRYLSPGEEFYAALMPALRDAKKYIFLEFFIIQDGKMWDSILDILTEKAYSGVDVRLIYDDVGCFLRLPKNYPEILERRGIKCRIFNPFRPMLSAVQNNRDHRKILSIDGKTAFTGGVNLSDEYINEKERFGYWKDSVLMLKGNAAWSLTVIFLEMWGLLDASAGDIDAMRPEISGLIGKGFVQPFADSPLSSEHVAAKVFLHLITNAKRTIYINTPYLILDDSFLNALCSAAKFGADVRIITPHHPDKPIVHATTRSYYGELLASGVRVYEYTDGFLHSKSILIDDEIAVIGTSNFDYRSLYLHFECGVLMYGTAAVEELRDDFLETLEKCQEMKLEDFSPGIPGRLFQAILRLFSPLM